MAKLSLLLLGALAAVVFAAMILVIVPSQILPNAPTHPPLEPYTAEESPLKPYTSEELAGRALYMENGCYYCHSQQVRDPIISVDVQRGWGRPSYPSDYIYDQPALLGTQRTGPDLINVGARLPDPNWHLVHLYQPRALVPWSIMPAFQFLFAEKDQAAANDEILKIPPQFAPQGKVVVITPAARNLVTYLLSLKRDFPAPELKIEQEQNAPPGKAGP